MDEFEFLRRMYFRLDEMRRCYGKEEPTDTSAAEAAIQGAIRDYLAMRQQRGERTEHYFREKHDLAGDLAKIDAALDQEGGNG